MYTSILNFCSIYIPFISNFNFNLYSLFFFHHKPFFSPPNSSFFSSLPSFLAVSPQTPITNGNHHHSAFKSLFGIFSIFLLAVFLHTGGLFLQLWVVLLLLMALKFESPKKYATQNVYCMLLKSLCHAHTHTSTHRHARACSLALTWPLTQARPGSWT